MRIFVTDGDLLLTHPEYRYYMRGVIIGSTYPLVPRNQNWVKAGDDRARSVSRPSARKATTTRR